MPALKTAFSGLYAQGHALVCPRLLCGDSGLWEEWVIHVAPFLPRLHRPRPLEAPRLPEAGPPTCVISCVS